MWAYSWRQFWHTQFSWGLFESLVTTWMWCSLHYSYPYSVMWDLQCFAVYAITQNDCKEYSNYYCQSHKTLLWTLIMSCYLEYAGTHEISQQIQSNPCCHQIGKWLHHTPLTLNGKEVILSGLDHPVPGKFLGIVGQDPSDSKSTWLHVDIFRFCFIYLRYILWIF